MKKKGYSILFWG